MDNWLKGFMLELQKYASNLYETGYEVYPKNNPKMSVSSPRLDASILTDNTQPTATKIYFPGPNDKVAEGPRHSLIKRVDE